LRTEARAVARRARSLVRRVVGRAAPAAATPHPPRLLGLDDIASLPRPALQNASRALASPLYLGGNVALCRILARYKLYVDSRDSAFASHVLLDGYREPWLTQFIARTVAPGTVAADVGANFGYYTLLLADLVGPDGRVLAVEPNADAAELMRRSIMLNGYYGRAEVETAAAGAAEGETATIWVPEGRPGGAAVVDAALAVPPGFERREVPVATLDRLLADGPRVGFVKIDAEGSEERIVAGMGRLFAEHRPVVVLEFNPARYPDPAAFLDRLECVYGRLSHVDDRGRAAPVRRSDLLSRASEWLLVLRPR
jgi:FkbM family methyltransferase